MIVGGVFIAAGIFGFAYHVTELGSEPVVELLWVLILRLLAIAGGVFLLRGANWARWLLVAWMGYHSILSFRHSTLEVLIHCAILAGIAYVLFRSGAKHYFRGSGAPELPSSQ